MSVKVPIRTVYDGSNAVGLAEFQSGEFIGLTHGGLGASLSIGSAGQVLKVNSGATALEFGSVEAVFNIDGMTDGSAITIADSDKLPISDGGTEKYILASQISSYVDATSGTLTNKTISGSSNTLSNIGNSSLTNSSITIVDDTSTTTTISLGESLLLSGGTGITSVISGDSITFNIDDTVTTLTGSQTLTNKTLTSPKINEDVAITATATELNYTDGVTSNIQTQLDSKAAKSFAIAQAIALG